MKALNEKELRLVLETRYDDLLRTFPGRSRRFLLDEKKRAKKLFPPEVRIDLDYARLQQQSQAREFERLYKASLTDNERLRKALSLAQNFPATEAREITIASQPGEREATAIALASDWHMEEKVTLEQTNGLNEHNLQIADTRSRWFFKNVYALVDKEAQSINIKNLILWIGGDMISGSIHNDLAEANELGPMDAVAFAQDTIAGGISQLLKDLPGVQLTVVFSSGNHGRGTDEQRWATEHENSLEFLMAHSIAWFFKGNDRVRFVRDRSLLTYVEVHGRVIRFLHGHAMNYSGGVGGITIPALKAIANWDKGRQAYMTMFGHFHSLHFHPSFVCNGSALGFSAYSMAIKAAYEPPQQAFCLIDSKHGMTMRAPILLEEA